jgi:hypothetical protein
VPDVSDLPLEQLSQKYGTVLFRITNSKLYDNPEENLVIINHRVDEIIFQLYRDTCLNLVFTHHSTSTGIRKSKVNLLQFDFAPALIVAMRWSNTENYLFVSNMDYSVVKVARAEQKGGKIRVGADGSVIQIGDNGIDVASYRMVQDGKDILLPLAKEAWDSTIIKVNVLIDGCKLKDFLFETTIVQQCIVMLVTGLEVYAKNRFIEMERNGRIPNSEALMKEFASSENMRRDVENYSSCHNVSLLQALIQVRGNGAINFQDWEKCKQAFNKGHNIKFVEIKDLNPVIIEDIRRYCQWRHKIIHSIKDMGMLNMEEVPPKEPIFANKEFFEKARDGFVNFIEKLHKQTV